MKAGSSGIISQVVPCGYVPVRIFGIALRRSDCAYMAAVLARIGRDDGTMPNDPQPLSDASAGPPDEAALEKAAHAEIVTSGRGRSFLTEYPSGSAHADTLSLGDTVVRVAGRSDPLPPAGLARDLIDLAAAIEWVEAELAASGTPAPDGLAAVERIQDIAFALRECEVDATLCDALEAAIRKLGDVVARSDAAAERVQSAAALLRIPARRINAMIALAAAIAGPGVEPLAVAPAAVGPAAAQTDRAIKDEPAADLFERETPPPAERAVAEARGDDHVAEAVHSQPSDDRARVLPAIPRPAFNGPLAALGALSEEELIALFS
jgi:hypothetical protein